jgi:hypothetical protein
VRQGFIHQNSGFTAVVLGQQPSTLQRNPEYSKILGRDPSALRHRVAPWVEGPPLDAKSPRKAVLRIAGAAELVDPHLVRGDGGATSRVRRAQPMGLTIGRVARFNY